MAKSYTIRNGGIYDVQTGSRWSIDGVAVEGSLACKALERLPSGPEFWFVRASFFKDTEILKNS